MALGKIAVDLEIYVPRRSSGRSNEKPVRRRLQDFLARTHAGLDEQAMMKISDLKVDFSALALVVPVTFLFVWFAMDRDPPYVRESGEMLVADPSECHLENDAPRGLSPGACVSPQWKVRAIRQCDPSPGYPV